jgi:hypothetical protein
MTQRHLKWTMTSFDDDVDGNVSLSLNQE